MSVKAIIGLGYGDEGKGVTTEYLCSQDPKNTIVIRFSGGHQAGHKVIKDNIEHIFSSFGSGTLSGCPTYWSQYCTVNPIAFWNEYDLLFLKGIKPKIFFHPDCPITTIYDIFANKNSIELQHGTTGTGFFRTRKRHFVDGIRFTIYDMFFSSLRDIRKKHEEIKKYYNIKEDLNLELFEDVVYYIKDYLGKEIVTDKIPDYKHRVYEGSQGLMLNEHIGYMPHCTPSDITPRNILNLEKNIDEIFLITRVYQTRHGNGPMTNENHPVKPINNEKETNVFNQFQGEFKSTVLDLTQLVRAKTLGIDKIIPVNTKINLVVTCLDQLSEYKVSQLDSMWSFKESEKFIRFLGDCLNINGDLYMNDSPYSTSIKKI